MSESSESPVMAASPSQVVPMETIRPRPPQVYYGEEPRRTGNKICVESHPIDVIVFLLLSNQLGLCVLLGDCDIKIS